MKFVVLCGEQRVDVLYGLEGMVKDTVAKPCDDDGLASGQDMLRW